MGSTLFALGAELIIPFKEYVQYPACGFEVTYTLTLLEIPHDSNWRPAFRPQVEGDAPEPEFVFLDLELGELQLAPVSVDLTGRQYAVYINGHVAVNRTI